MKEESRPPMWKDGLFECSLPAYARQLVGGVLDRKLADAADLLTRPGEELSKSRECATCEVVPILGRTGQLLVEPLRLAILLRRASGIRADIPSARKVEATRGELQASRVEETDRRDGRAPAEVVDREVHPALDDIHRVAELKHVGVRRVLRFVDLDKTRNIVVPNLHLDVQKRVEVDLLAIKETGEAKSVGHLLVVL